jgi:spore germination cell wall hydrolase CwlJ-like protein
MLLIDPVSCLAAAIYFEARGEIQLDQIRVAETILNRVESKRYPNTVCEVVKQKHQFSFYWDGKKETIYDTEAWLTSWDLANIALCSKINDPTICHYAQKQVKKKWMVNMTQDVHGTHAFYSGGC